MSNQVLLEKPAKASHTCLQRYNLVIVVLSGVVIALAIAAIIVFLAVNASRDATQRMCVNAGEKVLGSLTTRINERQIQWDFQYQGLSSPILGVQIRGPIAPGMTTAPNVQALCGTPSTLLCDLSAPNVLSGMITQTDPGAQSLRPVIQGLRAKPYAYYVDFCTVNHDCAGGAPGEVRAYLNQLCSTSVD